MYLTPYLTDSMVNQHSFKDVNLSALQMSNCWLVAIDTQPILALQSGRVEIGSAIVRLSG